MKPSIFIFFLITFSLHCQTRVENLARHINYLASPELEGRLPGSDGIEKAASYIESEFKTIGLKALEGNYRQDFDVTMGKKLVGRNEMSFEVLVPRPGLPKEKWKKRTRKWTPEKDWLPMGFSSSGTYSGEVAYVGYGISAEKLGYDDYAGIDVGGKAVIIISDSPDGEDRTGEFAAYASFRYKTTNAKKHGAAAILFINIQGDSADVFQPIENMTRIGRNAGIVTLQMSRSKLAKLFPRKKQLYPLEKLINDTHKPQSFIIPDLTLTFETNIEDMKNTTSNIFGVLEGSEIKDEYIFIGAHYDHLGWGKGQNSRYKEKIPKIHPGADDNASGTAAVIEFARYFAKNPPRRSIVFCAWSAEEMGLLGSKYFVNNLPIDSLDIFAYFNFDMIGRLAKGDEIQILGTGTSLEWDELLEAQALSDSLGIRKIKAGYGPSDHSSFYTKKRPVLAFFSGIHSDYHTPGDTPNKIQYGGIEKIMDFASSIILTSDNMNALEYAEVSDTEMKKKMSRMRFTKVTFGVIPNYAENDHGFVIDGVSPGGSAALGGLKGGDIIIEIDDNKIDNIYDFMYAYMEKNPGDVVSVSVLRGGKKNPIKFNVKLAAKD